MNSSAAAGYKLKLFLGIILPNYVLGHYSE